MIVLGPSTYFDLFEYVYLKKVHCFGNRANTQQHREQNNTIPPFTNDIYNNLENKTDDGVDSTVGLSTGLHL